MMKNQEPQMDCSSLSANYPQILGQNIFRIVKLVGMSKLGHDEIEVLENSSPSYGESLLQIKVINNNLGFAKDLGFEFVKNLQSFFKITNIQFQQEDDKSQGLVIYAKAEERTFFTRENQYNKVVIYKGMLYDLKDTEDAFNFRKAKEFNAKKESEI